MTEIKLFYAWLETHPLTPASIALWHGLMFIANCSGWQQNLNIPISRLESKTNMPRSSIYREREKLKQAGLIDYQSRGGRSSSVYAIRSLEVAFVSYDETQKPSDSHFASHTDTQSGTQESVVSHLVSQIETQPENIYKLNQTNTLKENKKRNEVANSSAPMSTTPQKKEEKNCAKKERKRGVLFDIPKWLTTLDAPWQELMRQWLEYKQSRRERYRSEMSANKCLNQLKVLSGGNPQTAMAIIDQSIANNWAGLFELRSGNYPARGQPATGQHVGQIKQPETEDKKQKLLEKFRKSIK